MIGTDGGRESENSVLSAPLDDDDDDDDDWGSVPVGVILKTQKMVLDVSLFNTQH